MPKTTVTVTVSWTMDINQVRIETTAVNMPELPERVKSQIISSVSNVLNPIQPVSNKQS